MPEEIKEQVSVSEQEPVEDTSNLIEAIKEIKANSVSKEDYEKLKEENNQLVDALINGGQVELKNDEKKDVDVETIREELFTDECELCNIDFVEHVLDLRDDIISKGGIDPFLPVSHEFNITEDDIACADRVATVFKECIDYADGDSQLFTQELQRRMIDAKKPIGGKTSGRR